MTSLRRDDQAIYTKAVFVRFGLRVSYLARIGSLTIGDEDDTVAANRTCKQRKETDSE